MCRKYAVPMEEMELQGDAQERCSANDTHPDSDTQESSTLNGCMDSRRRRPISVIGGVDLFASPDEKDDAELPSVSLDLFILSLSFFLISNLSQAFRSCHQHMLDCAVIKKD